MFLNKKLQYSLFISIIVFLFYCQFVVAGKSASDKSVASGKKSGTGNSVAEIGARIDLDKALIVIAKNEIDNKENMIAKFSLVKGRPGYTFGRCQFDVQFNDISVDFLVDRCKFKEDELDRLFKRDKDISDLNQKLAKCRPQIDKYDKEHIKEAIKHIKSLGKMPNLENEKTLMQLIDHYNQFYLSKGSKFLLWLQDQASAKKTVTSEDIKKIKLENTVQGPKSDEILRRWNNIEKYYK